MSYPLSRAMSAATAAYGVFAAVKPRHVAEGVGAPPEQAPAYDVLAYTYAARDLPVSALGVFGSEKGVQTAMLLRIVGDVTDAAILGSSTRGESRAKVVGVALGWGVLNTAALVLDKRSIHKRRARG